MWQYVLGGLRVESDLEFPELTSWAGPDEAPSEIQFRLGPVKPLQTENEGRFRFEAHDSGGIAFFIPAIGRALVEGGRTIWFEPFAGIDPLTVRANFIGIIQAMLWHQRRYLPLHGTALQVGDRAIAVAGPARSGKSVTAAALTILGYPLVADDFTIVDWNRDVPLVLPAYQKLRLMQDACEELGLLDAAIAKAHPLREKYVLKSTATPPDHPLSLSDVFVLAPDRADAFGAESLGPVQAMQNILTSVHLLDAAYAIGLQKQVFSALNAIVSSVQVWRITVPQGLEHALETAESIVALASR